MHQKKFPGLFINQGVISGVEDVLAIEEALHISINEEPFTITMRTPGDEEDLVRGLLFTEGIYEDRNTDPEMVITGRNINDEVTEVNINVPENKLLKKYAGTRSILSVSSCGICGKTSLDENEVHTIRPTDNLIGPSLIEKMFDEISRHQIVFRESGGTHASGAFTADGRLLVMREDIGRHNAVDKVIGALLLNRELSHAACLTVSGRISYEIVSKAAAAGIPILASVSAPSSLAVKIAIENGITLLAFCRNQKMTVYAHPERIDQVQTV